MEKFTPHIFAFMLPLIIGNVLHMLVVKADYFRGIAYPLSIHLFGAGKTYRAFAVLPLVCALSSLAICSLTTSESGGLRSFFVGFILGLAYLIGELPNSFIKRRLGISSGMHHPRYKLVQYIIDKSDSLLATCLVYFLITEISAGMTCILFGVSFSIHVVFSWLLVQVRIKKSF
jgi:CDP-diglyceride synthetase